ncbi:Golgi to ER traffic protein 4 [Wickerhamiella sorbophila]|uniref:Golgi to ER traffic protein 4 n=1 Tax=Wickerhamiella sorbophila TaxID=45607 RepID=A0A2T0FNZ6_9ASCO|nr:Golgi to ER traffic protein 4 [Wickerhamiella sorbophila]PRT56712.1 Golgi to ER traffic protein 4 [Wickerhamiella sorbophila]
MSSIEKTLARVNERVILGQYYEAHQAVRTVVSRYLRQKAYGSAIGLLYNSCILLVRKGQTGSIADLLSMMIEVYKAADVAVDSVSKGRIAQILWQINGSDQALKQVVQPVISWSAKHGAEKSGDPELHHIFGSLFSHAGLAEDAEKHFLLGTRDSAAALAEMHARWHAKDSNNATLYISRGILGYLSVQNIRNARVYTERALQDLIETLDEPVTTEHDIFVFEDEYLLNFLQMLIPACQIKEGIIYRQLADHYKVKSIEGWSAALQTIEGESFGIYPQRGFNLMDLMGGAFR